MQYQNFVLDPARKRRIRIIKTLIVLVALLFLSLFVSININHFYIRVNHLGTYYQEEIPMAVLSRPQQQVKGLDISQLSSSSSASATDYRSFVLDEYFRIHRSPLYGTGRIFVRACNKYGAPGDCTTVAAIAHAETDLCKYHNSASYYNCWGFGGGGEDRIYFKNWEESIDLVTDRLVNAYGRKYMIDPSLMEKTFCGSEPGCTNWGFRVKHFMDKLNNFPLQMGLNQKLNSFR